MRTSPSGPDCGTYLKRGQIYGNDTGINIHLKSTEFEAGMDCQTVCDYIKKKYKTSPEYLWRKYPGYAVFRHEDNHKWFALAADVAGEKVGRPDAGSVDVVNLKVDDLFFRDMLIQNPGIMPAYHMNKQHWISVLLDGSIPREQVFDLIDLSYMATASAQKKEKIRPPKEWVVPANPKYFDIVHAFDDKREINWKQGAGIKKGDTVCIYVGAPVSAILYRCKVTETGIPYVHRNEKLTIKALMKIRLQKRYPADMFTFDVLKSEYGIYAVRGPRGIPNSLSEALRRM